MAYVKHPEHGNKHVPDSEVEALVAQGWVKWPRTKEQKAALVVEEVPSPVTEPAKPPEERQKRKYTRRT